MDDFGFYYDDEGYLRANHPIFTCTSCLYETSSVYTACVINDLHMACPKCGHEVLGQREWCNDGCDWYTRKLYKPAS